MTDKKDIPLVASIDEQLRLWVEGTSVHHALQRGGHECCPDFSCCKPHLLQPIEVRRAFVAADERGRNKFLMVFLGGAISDARPDVQVHITDGNPEIPS